MNCVSVRCCVVLKMCCYEHMINVKVWNVILWLNPWDKWCYAMSGKMMRIVLSWACYTYMCVCVCAHTFVYLYLFRNVITHSLWAICVWILWWSRNLCLWEKMVRWMTLKNLVLEDAVTEHSDVALGPEFLYYLHNVLNMLLYVVSLLNLFSFCKTNWIALFWTRDVFIPLFDKFLIWWLT